MSEYAWSVEVPTPVDVTIERVTAELAARGFGVLTRIDAHEVFKKKLGIDRPPYVILGACNPGFARQAIEAEPAIGILLPCNVVVEAFGAGSRVFVTQPETLLGLTGRADLAPIAADVAARLAGVRDALAGA